MNQNDRTDNYLDEKRLIERCRAGESSAYEEFYRIYADNIYTPSCRILNDPDGAKDAVQEVFIKAFRGLNNFQYQSKISTWLYRITVNQCRDMLRRKLRLKEIPEIIGIEEKETESILDQIPDQKPIPSREHYYQELRQKVSEAINRLPIEYREVIYLKEIENMNYEEIRKIVRCRMGTVKSRIFRARELLQKELQEFYQELKGDK